MANRNRLLGTFRLGRLTGGLSSPAAGSVGGGERVSVGMVYTNDTPMFYANDTAMEYRAV